MPWFVVRHARARNFCAIEPHKSYARRPHGLQCGASSASLNCGSWQHRSLIYGILLCLCSSAHPQSNFTRIYGAADSEIVLPNNAVPSPGRVDAAALTEIQQFQKTIGIAQWTGMQASGMFTENGQNALNATLSIMHGHNFRLDVTTPQGIRSIRVSDSSGQIRDADGKRHFLPKATAKNGLLAFPRLLDNSFPGPHVTVLDQGITQIEGKPLHRITLAEPVFPGVVTKQMNNMSLTDLYFDPSSHLLIKSAEYAQLDSKDSERYLIVITYGDYQNVQGSLIPLSYSQSLNGQPQWALQLNNPTLQPVANAADFHF
jgi:hypothetical protein